MDILLNVTQGLSGNIFGLVKFIFDIFILVWWVVLPFLLFEIFWKVRMDYLHVKNIVAIKWVMLELKMPKDVIKTPKSMEQVFSSLAGIYTFGPSDIEKYIEGKIEKWVSCEIVGFGNGVHFYFRVPEDTRNLLEASIYAQYPTAEITQVEDYTELLPVKVPNKEYDLIGATLGFIKSNYYPIRTYKFFEEIDEEKRVDPIAAITEVMSVLKEGEMVWIQYMIRPTGAPTGNDWQGEGRDKMDEMAGKKKSKPVKRTLFGAFFEFIKNLIIAPMKVPEWASAPEEKKTEVQRLHPGDQDTIKAIANKISKFGFETVIRIIYLDKRSSFSGNNFSAVLSTFQQFNDQTLNSFKPALTKVGGWRAKFFPKYKARKLFAKKRAMYDDYIARRFSLKKYPVLCTEELATLYHVPTSTVAAPKLRRLEAQKGEPPANLPINE